MRYGCKNARWAPMVSDDDATALPKYGTDVIKFDGLNEANDSPTFAEASAYGDDAKKLTIREFSGGTIETQSVNLPTADMAVMLGATSDGEALVYGGEDDAPFGGYGFVTSKMDSNKVKYYQAVFYPKVQAYVEGEDHKTKEDSISLEYDAISFNWFQPECKAFKITKDFTVEADATSYIEGLLGGTEALPASGEAEG